jgi:hypothetical protein
MSRRSNKRSYGGRVSASLPKAGITKSGSRRYSCGGKLKNK